MERLQDEARIAQERIRDTSRMENESRTGQKAGQEDQSVCQGDVAYIRMMSRMLAQERRSGRPLEKLSGKSREH